MFGNIKAHYKKLSAFGSKVAHKVTEAYGHGVKVAQTVSHGVDYAKKLYNVASPFLHEMMGGTRAKKIDEMAHKGFGHFDQMQGQAMNLHEGVMSKIQRGGEILNQMRNVEPPTMYKG